MVQLSTTVWFEVVEMGVFVQIEGLLGNIGGDIKVNGTLETWLWATRSFRSWPIFENIREHRHNDRVNWFFKTLIVNTHTTMTRWRRWTPHLAIILINDFRVATWDLAETCTIKRDFGAQQAWRRNSRQLVACVCVCYALHWKTRHDRRNQHGLYILQCELQVS